ncbi:MAG: hypothetical protein JOY64_21650 [Alphaproteobacteria bacterium]|nr:hypothetical protein [Alphaproteobacteria bacterium]MBV8410248.1 hypothetical protein [Alphaproteobacteria bacterium]
MTAQSAIRWGMAYGIAALAVACSDPKSSPGRDEETRSTATTVTWSDGKPAISIQCDTPGGCQTRAMAMCNGGNYTVITMTNMPTRGDMTQVRGPASTVVRCS